MEPPKMSRRRHHATNKEGARPTTCMAPNCARGDTTHGFHCHGAQRARQVGRRQAKAGTLQLRIRGQRRRRWSGSAGGWETGLKRDDKIPKLSEERMAGKIARLQHSKTDYRKIKFIIMNGKSYVKAVISMKNRIVNPSSQLSARGVT